MEPVVDGNVPLGHNLEVAEGATLEVLPVDFAVVMERERDAKFQVVKDAETDKQVFVVGGRALIEFRLVPRFVCVVAFDAGRLSVVDDFEAARNKRLPCGRGFAEGAWMPLVDLTIPTWAEAAIERVSNAAKSFFIRCNII